MAVAMDLGNPYSPFSSAHPTNEKDVGSRLALASLSVAYEKMSIILVHWYRRLNNECHL